MVRACDERRAIWLGDSLESMKEFPEDVQDALGHDLGIVQRGGMPKTAEAFSQVSNKVIELKDDFEGDTYRLFCAVGFSKGVFVLDAFKKKSKKGCKYSQEEVNRIRRRFEFARGEDASR